MRVSDFIISLAVSTVIASASSFNERCDDGCSAKCFSLAEELLSVSVEDIGIEDFRLVGSKILVYPLKIELPLKPTQADDVLTNADIARILGDDDFVGIPKDRAKSNKNRPKPTRAQVEDASYECSSEQSSETSKKRTLETVSNGINDDEYREEFIAQRAKVKRTKSIVEKDEKMKILVQYIEDNPTEVLDVKKIASITKRSWDRAREFQAAIGLDPYINNLATDPEVRKIMRGSKTVIAKMKLLDEKLQIKSSTAKKVLARQNFIAEYGNIISGNGAKNDK